MNKGSKLFFEIMLIVGIVSSISLPFLAKDAAKDALVAEGYTVKSLDFQLFQMSCYALKNRLRVNFTAEGAKGYVCVSIPFDPYGSKIHVED